MRLFDLLERLRLTAEDNVAELIDGERTEDGETDRGSDSGDGADPLEDLPLIAGREPVEVEEVVLEAVRNEQLDRAADLQGVRRGGGHLQSVPHPRDIDDRQLARDAFERARDVFVHRAR